MKNIHTNLAGRLTPRRNRFIRGCLLLVPTFLLLLGGPSVFAEALILADATRPGAVRPPPELRPEPSLNLEVGEAVDIPALIDRPFDIEEGPFVIVREFRLLDAEALPEYGIRPAEIQADILEKALAEQPERGFSIGELQEVADAVTAYYRARGLILSTAVIPVQTVESGRVDIQIFIGRLGRVLAEGNERYREEMLRKPFLKLIGQPVTQEGIEAALLTLTDYPGLSVFGLFQPGLKVGESDIVLRVQQEKAYDVALRIDNHGLKETGRNRLRGTINWNNPTGYADRFTATYQQSYSPKNRDYWSLDYERYLGNGYTFGLGTLKSRFNVGGQFASNRIAAEAATNSLYLEKSFIRSRRFNLSSRLSLARKKSTTRNQGRQVSQDRVTALTIDVDYDAVDTFHPLRRLYRAFFKEMPENFGGGLNYARISYNRGFNDIFGALGSSADQRALNAPESRTSRRGGSGKLASGQFNKINLNYQRLQSMTINQSLLFRTELQWTNDLLVPLEQYSVGGPTNVRGFPDAQGLFDKAWFFSLEYIFNAPFIADRPAFANRTWGELLQLSVFYDFAMGAQNDPLKSEADPNTSGSWITFKSVGAGLRFNLPDSIDSRIMYATELGPDVPNDGRHGRVWADFTWSF